MLTIKYIMIIVQEDFFEIRSVSLEKQTYIDKFVAGLLDFLPPS